MINLQTDDLKAALATVSPAAGKSSTHPILENLLLTVTGGWATLTAQDGTREISSSLESDSSEDEAILIPAAKLKGIVAQSGAAPSITLHRAKNSGDSIIASVNRSRFTLASLPVADYPRLTRDDSTHDPELATVQLTGELLAGDIKAVLDCIASNDVRAYLNGLCIQLTEQHINLVATNGHLIGWIQREAEPILHAAGEGSFVDGVTTVILPRVTAADLTREKGSCTLTLRRRSMTAAYPPLTTLHSRLIEGTYPNWESLFPAIDSLQPPIIVEREPMLSALKYAQVIADSDQYLAVRIQTQSNRMTISLDNAKNENCTSDLPTFTTSETPQAITINVHYLIAILSHMSSPEVALYLNAESTMLHLLPNPTPAGYRQRYAVMSMKV